MRARPHRQPKQQSPHPRGGLARRRKAVVPPEHLEERRMRASGGPEDRARYSCACGFVWEAEVSTSVRCPHCGAAQAW